MKVLVVEGVQVDEDMAVAVVVAITETLHPTMRTLMDIPVVKVPLKTQTPIDLMVVAAVATVDLVVVTVVVAVVVRVMEKLGMESVLAGFLNAAVGLDAGKQLYIYMRTYIFLLVHYNLLHLLVA